MEKFTREYAEKLATEQGSASLYDLYQVGFTEGYMKAIEETNATELLEALKNADKIFRLYHNETYDGSLIEQEITNLINRH